MTAAQSIRMICLLSGVAMAGCASADRVITSENLKYPEREGQWTVLANAYSAAYAAAKNDTSAAKAMDSDEKRIAYEALAEAGYDMIAINCSDFFSKAGTYEKWIVFARDTVGTVGTVATGAIALFGGGSMATAISALTTATLYNGLDLYTRNFLFNAENVSNVRRLILDVVAADREARTKLVNGKWTFGLAVAALQDNQELCRSSAIVVKVKESIQAGKPTIRYATDPANPNAALQDANLDVALVQVLGTIPNDKEKRVLYWYTQGAESDAETAQIMQELMRLSREGRGPYTTAGTDNPNWGISEQRALIVAFGQISAPRKTDFDASIAEWRRQLAAANPPPAADGSGAALGVSPQVAPTTVELSEPAPAQPEETGEGGYRIVIE